MVQLIKGILCFIIYLMIYYLIGTAVSKILKLKNNPLHELLYGMFAYGILFFVYVMPLKFKLVPVSTIGAIWAVLISIICILIIITMRKYMLEGLKEWLGSFKEQKLSVIPVVIFSVVFILFIELYGRLPAGFNQVWFLGWPSNAVLHNELMTYDCDMGTPLEKFNYDRYLCTFLDHSGVVCKLTGLHVMVEVRSVLTAIFVLMQIIIIWEMAKYFGKDDQRKVLLAFFLYWTVRNLLVGSQLLPGYYTIFRTYEGKGFVMNISFTLLALIFWKMYDTPEDTGWLWKSSIMLIGSMTYSLSMMFSAPFMLVSYIPFVLVKKDKRLIRNMFVLLFITGIYFLVYLLSMKDIIDLTIHR